MNAVDTNILIYYVNDPRDPGKKVPKITLDEAKTQFNAQAEKLSSSGNVVHAYILNTALR